MPRVPFQPWARGRPYSTAPIRRATFTLPSGPVVWVGGPLPSSCAFACIKLPAHAHQLLMAADNDDNNNDTNNNVNYIIIDSNKDDNINNNNK